MSLIHHPVYTVYNVIITLHRAIHWQCVTTQLKNDLHADCIIRVKVQEGSCDMVEQRQGVWQSLEYQVYY